MGAWIETFSDLEFKGTNTSHPSWVRGLKHKSRFIGGSDATSHPSWVRGLKRDYVDKVVNPILSHPSWVRGLKQFKNLIIRRLICRTPRGCVD